MDATEFANWKKLTASSAHRWTVDEVRKHNDGTLLAYKGGADGVYVELAPDGTAKTGHYHGAVPHIGEALFQAPLFTKKFATQSDALARISERLGLNFLLAITHGQSPYAA